MKTTIITLCLLLCVVDTVIAQQMQPVNPALAALKPDNFFPERPEKGYVFTDRIEGEKPATINAGFEAATSPLFTTEVFAPAQNAAQIQAVWKSEKPLKKGDAMLGVVHPFHLCRVIMW